MQPTSHAAATETVRERPTFRQNVLLLLGLMLAPAVPSAAFWWRVLPPDGKAFGNVLTLLAGQGCGPLALGMSGPVWLAWFTFALLTASCVALAIVTGFAVRRLWWLQLACAVAWWGVGLVAVAGGVT